MTTNAFSPNPFNSCFEAASAAISNIITPIEIMTLSSRATAAKATAYCPYSNFRVGCSLLTLSGEFIDGANVENAVCSVGMCAEMVAMGKAVSGNPPARKFKAIGIATDISPPAGPCGMCRHMRDFCDPETPIFMFDKDGKFEVKTFEELLPKPFGTEALPLSGQSVRS